MSSSRVNVPRSSSAPTVITHGSFAGEKVTPSFVERLVARGGDHDDAGVPGLLDRRVQRIGLVGLGRGRGQRQVDHADAVLGLVVDRELDPGDHVEDGGVAVVVGDLDRDQVRPRRDAHVAAVVSCCRSGTAGCSRRSGRPRACRARTRRSRPWRTGWSRPTRSRASRSSRASGSRGCHRRCRCRPPRRRRRGPRCGTRRGRRGWRGPSAEQRRST